MNNRNVGTGAQASRGRSLAVLWSTALSPRAMVTKSGTLRVKDEDTWQPPIGPREVECHQCSWWVDFYFVSYRGVFEDADDPRQDADTSAGGATCNA